MSNIKLEDILALDIIGTRLHFTKTKKLLVLQNAENLEKLESRITSKVHVVFAEENKIPRGLGGKIHIFEIEELFASQDKFGLIALVDVNSDIIEKIDSALENDGHIILLIPNRFSLSSIHRSISQIRKLKKRYSIKEFYGIYTLESLFYGILWWISKILHRPDLQDRYHFKFRKNQLSNTLFKYTGTRLLIMAAKK